jgi:hypothetical protein
LPWMEILGRYLNTDLTIFWLALTIWGGVVLYNLWGSRCGRDRMVVGFKLSMQLVSIITNIVSSNPAHDEVYSMQPNYIMWKTLLVTGDRSLIFSGYSGFLHQ